MAEIRKRPPKLVELYKRVEEESGEPALSDAQVEAAWKEMEASQKESKKEKK